MAQLSDTPQSLAEFICEAEGGGGSCGTAAREWLAAVELPRLNVAALKKKEKEKKEKAAARRAQQAQAQSKRSERIQALVILFF
jgi:hypothetical protein